MQRFPEQDERRLVEAVRGVNAYAAPSGKTVEFDVTADHVAFDDDHW